MYTGHILYQGSCGLFSYLIHRAKKQAFLGAHYPSFNAQVMNKSRPGTASPDFLTAVSL